MINFYFKYKLNRKINLMVGRIKVKIFCLRNKQYEADAGNLNNIINAFNSSDNKRVFAI